MKRIAFAVAIMAVAGAGLYARGGQAPAPAPAARRAAPAAPAAPAPAAAQPARRASVTPAPSHAGMSAAMQTELVATYCVGCHSERGKAGGLSLAGFNAMKAAEQPAMVEKIIRKLRAGMMPPAGSKRPDAATLEGLTTSLEARMDELASVNPNPGYRPFQRLNRAEYTVAIKDMLGIDVDVSAFLPADTISNGFDNVADSQAFSATLMEGYLRAAGRITQLALGDPNSSPTEATYKVPRTQSQMVHIDGLMSSTAMRTPLTEISICSPRAALP